MESMRKKKKKFCSCYPRQAFLQPLWAIISIIPWIGNAYFLTVSCLNLSHLSKPKSNATYLWAFQLPKEKNPQLSECHQVSSLWVCLTALSYHCPGHACVIFIHDILSADAFLEGMVSIWPSTRFSHTRKGVWQMLREMLNKCIVYTWMIRHSHTELIWVIQPISFCHKVCSHSYWDLNTSSTCYRFFSTLIFLTLVSLKTG